MAVDLLQRHLQTLVADPEQWQTLIADDIVWELAYAPALGHPARLSGRGEVMRHVAWFLGAVENFRFFDARYYAFADPHGAAVEVRAEGLIKSTGRIYRQVYVLFLHAAGGKIVSCVSISIPCARPRRWTRRFSASTRDGEWRRRRPLTRSRTEPSPNQTLHLTGSA